MARGIDTSETRPWQQVRKGYKRFQDGDVLFAKITPCMENGKLAVAKGLRNGVGAGSTEFHVLRPSNAIRSDLLAYYMLRNDFRASARSKMKGTAGQLRVPQRFLEAQTLCVPPLHEQKRIVEAVDSYFTRLDDVTSTLARLRRNLKRYRASILKAAVQGRLVPTEAELARSKGRDYEPAAALLRRILAERRRRWEEAELARMEAARRTPTNDKWKVKYREPTEPHTAVLPSLPEGWCWSTVNQFAFDVRYGSSTKSQPYSAAGVPMLRMGNIVDGALSLKNLRCLPADHHELPDLLLKPEDILFNRTNSADLVGKTAVFHEQNYSCTFASYLIRLRCLPGVYADYVAQYINSVAGRVWVSSVSSQQVGQANVNGTKLKTCPIPLPPIGEQERIIAATERALLHVTQLAVELEEKLAECDWFREAILKSAFEGKLTTEVDTG